MAIFAVDFDGTIVQNNYPEIGELRMDEPHYQYRHEDELGKFRPVPSVSSKSVMMLMRERGHTIIIWTCRSGEKRCEMIKYLIMNDIPFDMVNEHSPVMSAMFSDTRKIFADYYIDDHNVSPWTWVDIERLVHQLPIIEPARSVTREMITG
jgi:hypothetical protein